MGFGLARPKKEGSPVHPDDMLCSTDKQYQRQLAAYEAYWGKEQDADQDQNAV